MRIGVLRERKPDETRVALTPREVAVLAGRGHTVDVEPGAGVAAGYPDAAFVRAGATLSPKAQILAACRLLLKVKAPLPEEYEDYAPHHILMTFLHFDENIDPACLARLVSRGFLGIACEAVRVSGRAPILEPMSRLTGHLFAQRAIELCTRHSGRLAPGLDPALGQVGALLIGTGEIGLSVLQVWRALRLRLTVLANRDRDAVNAEANHRFGTRDRDYLPADEVTFLQMDVTDPARTQAALAAALPSVAIVVNAAVRRSSLPRDRLAHLITRPMLAALAPGSIVCDATACDRDLIETCVSSPDLAAVETIDGIIHYSPDHIRPWCRVPQATSTRQPSCPSRSLSPKRAWRAPFAPARRSMGRSPAGPADSPTCAAPRARTSWPRPSIRRWRLGRRMRASVAWPPPLPFW